MRFPFEERRFLTNFDTARLPSVTTEVLVIGCGVAGLTAAITLAERGRRVLLICKDAVTESNTNYAQGGIAVVTHKSDSLESHIQDTVACGAGLCVRQTVEAVVREGPDRIKNLLRCGAKFDTEDSSFSLAREGGHSHPRIIHAGGDETGPEIAGALIKKTKTLSSVTLRERVFIIDLLTVDRLCFGALAYDLEKGERLVIWAQVTILATGGGGQLYRETTNPAVATADGIAIAYRAGAQLRDIEFIQFHPTTLYLAGAARALISETVRGEGGILRDRDGVHFMPNYHPMGDLAPRDIVSRSIVRQMQLTGDTNVYLDLTSISLEHIRKRFPRLWELCGQFQIDVSRNFVPVRPSAHYMIGGVLSDLHGKSVLKRLYVAGEAASTGLHGANRLGSNSLLEGLVFGHRAALGADRLLSGPRPAGPGRLRHQGNYPRGPRMDFEDAANSLKALLWRNVGIERERKGLEEALSRLKFWSSYIMDKEFDRLQGWVLQNMLTVGSLVAGTALRREETRGAHVRLDYPDCDNERWLKHILVKRKSPFTTAEARPA